MSEELIKNISLNFPHQEYEENLIILGKDGSLSVLNNTSKFLYENCDNQSVHTLTKRLIDACIEKDELNEKKVEMDVMNAIVQFEKKGFITFQNKYQVIAKLAVLVRNLEPKQGRIREEHDLWNEKWIIAHVRRTLISYGLYESGKS